jgi:hypothetical protein
MPGGSIPGRVAAFSEKNDSGINMNRLGEKRARAAVRGTEVAL